jgi:hypothetical protein
MTESTTPQIAALIEVLAAHDPNGLSRLQNTYKSAADILTQSLKLGVEKPQRGASAREIEAAYVDAALTALRAVRARVQPNLDYARERLSRAKTLRLTGALITAVTGAGVLTAVLSQWPTVVAAGGAIVNLSGSACALIAGHLEGPLQGDKRSISDLFESLIKTVVEADPIIVALEIDLQLGRLTPDVAKRVERANALAAELREFELRLGTP